MKKLLGIFFIILLLSVNAHAKKGSGELKLSKSTMTEFLMYLYGANNPKYSDGANKKNNPIIMSISKDGRSSSYYYCPYVSGCADDNYAFKSIKSCEKISNGSPCFVFAKKRKIVWDNGNNDKSKRRIKKKLLKEPYEIAKIVQELGFYDNDISELPGIDYNKVKIIEGTTITEKKETKTVKKYNLKGERALALSWEGYENLIAGSLKFDEKNYKGNINLSLPNSDGTCEGSYILQDNGKGTWNLSCSNNMGAAGTLKWKKDGGVTGTGRDFNDNKVKFTLSKQS